MGNKARIKRLWKQADLLDQIGKAYIHALGQFMAEEPTVTRFLQPVTSNDKIALTLQDKLERQGLNPEDLLRVMKHKARTPSPLLES